MVKLQIALDMMNFQRALDIASESVSAGADWIEAGTPLIKSIGMDAIRELKKKFPGKKIVADMKIMDVGALETEMAAKAGADIVTVLAVSSDDTIKEAVKAGNQYGAAVMVDLIDAKNPVERALTAEKLGAGYLCVHVGVDAQMKGANPLEILKAVAEAVNIPIAAAGGLNVSNVHGVVSAGAGIVIIGGAITKAGDVAFATKDIKEVIESGTLRDTTLHKKYSLNEIREAFSLVSTSNVSDAMHRKGAMSGLFSVNPGCKFFGPAVTVRTMDGDWAKPVEAIDIAEKGEVLVIEALPGHAAVWGELATHSCIKRGIAGVVIDGAARDIDDIKAIGFPIHCRYGVPNAGEPKGKGEINVEITCGGQTVRHGDWIIGDDSGVVVIPKEDVLEMANRALEVKERENRLREEIKKGGTLSSILELLKWEKIG